MVSYSRNIISHASSTAAGSLIQFLLIIILARFFEIAEFGRFTAIIAVIALAEVTTDFGLRVLAVQYYSLSEKDKEKYLFTYAVSIKALMFGILCFIVFLTSWELISPKELILGILIASLQPGTDPYLWFLRGAERLDIEAKIVFIWRFLNAILLGGLAYFDFNMTHLLWAWLLSNIVRMFFEKMIIHQHIPTATQSLYFKFDLINWDKLLSLLKKLAPIGLSLIVMAIYVRMNLFLIGYIGNATDVALYGAAFTIAISAGFVATSITISTFPSLVRAIEKESFDEAREITHKKINLISLVIGAGCIVGITLSTWIITTLYPAEYSASSQVMIWLFPGLYLSTINFGLKYLLNALHLNKKEILSVFYGMAALVILFFVLNKKLENIFVGAAIAWSLSEFVMFISKITLINKNSDLKIGSLNVAAYISFFLLMLYYAYMKQA